MNLVLCMLLLMVHTDLYGWFILREKYYAKSWKKRRGAEQTRLRSGAGASIFQILYVFYTSPHFHFCISTRGRVIVQSVFYTNSKLLWHTGLMFGERASGERRVGDAKRSATGWCFQFSDAAVSGGCWIDRHTRGVLFFCSAAVLGGNGALRCAHPASVYMCYLLQCSTSTTA
jgi:hypothetical protein